MLRDIAYVKDKYGEEMAHFARDNFPSILEEEGLLISILEKNFAHNKFLYYDLINNDLIIDFKNYINSFNCSEERFIKTDKTPSELLSEAGYILYECHDLNEIESFRKYYQKDEELCTFKGNRLKTCYVFFAVKENVNNIVRSINPKREDEYGTSVISIQFSKGDINTLSVKNRYNHTVKNPDATFSNNLERIIPGLTDSFAKNYNLNIVSNKGKFDITNLDYKEASDGKFYPYNYEINNIYYGPNNIIIDNGNIVDIYSDKSRYIVMDYFILDLSAKKIFTYDNSINDCFTNYFDNIEKVVITKTKVGKTLNIINSGKECILELDKHNKIISYENKYENEIKDNFLYLNNSLKKLDLENVIYIGNDCLLNNIDLESINIKNVKSIGNNFLYKNDKIKSINLENVFYISDNFMACNSELSDINVPRVLKIGDKFLWQNKHLKIIKLNNVKEIGDDFLTQNEILEYIFAPKLEKVGDSFLFFNLVLTELKLDKLKYIGDDFLNSNISLNTIYIPNVINIGKNFLLNNISLININLKNVEEIGMNFMYYNVYLENINVDKLRKLGSNFLYHNQNLKKFIAPNLEDIWDYFMYDNKVLMNFYAPKVKNIGDYFLYHNVDMLSLCINNVFEIGSYFMYYNKIMIGFDANNLVDVGDYFLYSNISMKHFKTPNIENKGINYLYNNPQFRHIIEKRKCLKIS